MPSMHLRRRPGPLWGTLRGSTTQNTFRGRAVLLGGALALLATTGCEQYDRQTDARVKALIATRQREALDRETPPDIPVQRGWPRPGPDAYEYAPHATTPKVPAGFEPLTSQPASQPTTQPASVPASAPAVPATLSTTLPATQPASAPAAAPREQLFTLTDALAYALRQRREYQTAKESLYLTALGLTLERHLWTPIFASELKTVYGNYGEATNFDQAMRFVADLDVSQRLPYGGEFTAKALAKLIRDVGKSITAEESGEVQLGLRVPLLRGAGHVAQEDLVQLERDLTYAVRTFERFRLRQLVIVAQNYFDLLRVKQNVIDNERSLARARVDYARARDMEVLRKGGSKLDTMRAKQRMLNAANTLAVARESFRSRADQFKLTIGMPVEEPLDQENLEDIETIERRVKAGQYTFLVPPPALHNERAAVAVAHERRLELLTSRDQVEDARRGVAISRNALLPDLDWNSNVTFFSDPEHYNVGALDFNQTNWRTEIVLGLPLERTAERNALRRSMISVRAAQRAVLQKEEEIRAEVRDAVYQLRLQDESLWLQTEVLRVAERRAEFAQIQFEQGEISNRDKIEAETDLLAAQNRVNSAKTSRWNALLEFRLATETLQLDDRQLLESGREPAE